MADFLKLAKEIENDIVAWRRRFHENPELPWQEEKTTAFVVEELKKMGCEIVHVGYGDTKCGVTADIAGGKGGGRCIALRGDMDALPLQEETDLPFRSKNDGVMHACGHDAHTAMLLGAAKVLSSMKSELKGKVRLCFQPAEEHGLKAGAKAMVDEGALDGVDVAFGIHVMSNLATGVFGYRSGPFMAAADAFELTITGKGGHGSAPEKSIDPTIALFQVGNAFQTVVSREISALDTAVVSFGGIKTSSHVFNIIPERVEVIGSVRTFLPEIQNHVEATMTRLANTVCEAYRCKADFKYKRFIPATINNPKVTELVKTTAISVLGEERTLEWGQLMGSEDFSYFCNKIPSSYAMIGIADEKKRTDMPHHSPKFDVDESVLPSGTAMYVAMACNYLENGI